MNSADPAVEQGTVARGRTTRRIERYCGTGSDGFGSGSSWGRAVLRHLGWGRMRAVLRLLARGHAGEWYSAAWGWMAVGSSDAAAWGSNGSWVERRCGSGSDGTTGQATPQLERPDSRPDYCMCPRVDELAHPVVTRMARRLVLSSPAMNYATASCASISNVLSLKRCPDAEGAGDQGST